MVEVKKRTFAATFIAALLTALMISGLVGNIVELAKANPYLFCLPDSPPNQPVIVVSSPENNNVYLTNDVKLDFIIYGSEWNEYNGFMSVEISFDLDRQKYEKDSRNVAYDSDYFLYGREYSHNLSNLTDGRHSVKVSVYTHALYGPLGGHTYAATKSSPVIYFTVDTKPPAVTILSMSNTTSFGEDVEVKYSVNKDVSWVGYSLNGQDFVELDREGMVDHSVGTAVLWRGNFTLPELPAGDYSLVVYARDLTDNMSESDVFQFTLEQEAQSEPEQFFPTTLVVFVVAALSVVIVGLMVYFKKRKN